MHCRLCRSYLGFNDIIECESKDCKFLEKVISKYGLIRIIRMIKAQVRIYEQEEELEGN